MALPMETKMSVAQRITNTPELVSNRVLPVGDEVEGYRVEHISKLAKEEHMANTTTTAPVSANSIELDMYNLKFGLFHEKQYGVRLKDSELDYKRWMRTGCSTLTTSTIGYWKASRQPLRQSNGSCEIR